MMASPELSLRQLNIAQNIDDSFIQSALSYRWKGMKPIHLILDLDATLVHAIQPYRLPKGFRYQEGMRGCFEIKFKLGRMIDGTEIISTQRLTVFTRPYAAQFINKVRKYCKLYLYTHGRREYAEAVLKVLDPHSMIFQKIMALEKNELDGVKKATDRLNFTQEEKEMTIIIDDQFHAWRDIDRGELLVMSARYTAMVENKEDFIKYFVPENPAYAYQELQNYHQENKLSFYSQLPALQLFLQKIFVSVSRRNAKVMQVGLKIQFDIFSGVKFATGFISMETRPFFEVLINSTGGKVVKMEQEAEYILTNSKEESKEMAISMTEKAYCKNYVMQGYLLKKRPPAAHFKTKFN